MNWKTTKVGEEIISALTGKVINKVEVNSNDGAIKEVILFIDGEAVRFFQDNYSMTISTPAREYVLTGQFKIGSVYAKLEPEIFKEEKKAKNRLEELLEENDTFEGVITPTTEV